MIDTDSAKRYGHVVNVSSFMYLSVYTCLTQFIFFQSPQNFFQIISNLLEEENKEKWEDAQKVSTMKCTVLIYFS